MNNEEKTEKKQIRETIHRHLKAPEILTTVQVANLGLELSRKSDGTIDVKEFGINCDIAFGILIKLKNRIEQNANLPTE